MNKDAATVLAEAIAALDGYSGEDLPKSYYAEAEEVIQRLEATGWGIERLDFAATSWAPPTNEVDPDDLRGGGKAP